MCRSTTALTLLATLALLQPATAAADQQEDTAMQSILDTYRTLAIEQWSARPADERARSIATWIETLNADGTWDGFDLTSRVNTRFPAGAHIGRVVALYTAYAADGDPQCRAAGERALGAFLKAGPSSTNWWQNEIGMPKAAVALLAVAGDALSGETQSALLAVVRDPLDRKTNRHSTFTGQNLLWRCRIGLLKGCVTGDAALVADAAAQAAGVIVVTADEGIQADGSFSQHGPQLYSHGYGMALTRDVSTLALMLAGTPWAFTDAHFEAIARNALAGQQWMMRGEGQDFHPAGRGLTRPGSLKAVGYRPAPARLAKADPARAEQYRQWDKRLAGQAPPLTGARHYWRNDYFVFQRPDFYFSVRMVSDRTCITESINGENIFGGALHAGATCLMRTGNEYQNIIALWDWTKLAGATSDENVDIRKGSYKRMGRAAFVGGVSDGHYGAAAMDYVRPTKAALRGKKAYLAFDEGILCLGADITGEADTLFTGVEQCQVTGPVAVAGKATAPGEYDLDGVSEVSHADVRYVFEPDQSVRLRFGQRTGSWHDCHLAFPNKIFTAEVFGLWLTHAKADAPADYGYTILPTKTAQSANPLKILRNDASIQAGMCEQTGVVQAVFYSPGDLACPGGLTITAEQPCIVLVTPAEGVTRVTIADPTQALKTIRVSINGQAKTIDLPQGMQAGASVVTRW